MRLLLEKFVQNIGNIYDVSFISCVDDFLVFEQTNIQYSDLPFPKTKQSKQLNNVHQLYLFLAGFCFIINFNFKEFLSQIKSSFYLAG